MKNSITQKIILFISGFIAIGIGAAILFFPMDFYAAYNMDLGQDVSLLNEMKASGGVVLALGLLIVAGGFIAKLTYISLLISTIVYLSYGVSRIISMMVDGMPAEGLQQAAALEVIIGLVSLIILATYRPTENT